MPPHDDPRHNLRLTPDLQKKLKHSAFDGGRSMNAEILARLERSFEPDPGTMMAEALRPVASMSEGERLKVGQLLVDLGALLSKKNS